MDTILDTLHHLNNAIVSINSGLAQTNVIEGWLSIAELSIDILTDINVQNKTDLLAKFLIIKKKFRNFLENSYQSHEENNIDSESTSQKNDDESSNPLDGFEELIEDFTKNSDIIINNQDSNEIQNKIHILIQEIDFLQQKMLSLTRPEKKKCETFLIKLISLKHKFEHAIKIGGGGDLDIKKENIRYDDFDSAFERRIRAGVISNLGHKDLDSFLVDAYKPFQDKVKQAVEEFDVINVNVMLMAEFELQKDDTPKREVTYFSTENGVVVALSNLERFFDEKISLPLQRDIQEFETRDSGWSLKQIISLTININKHEPIRGSSYVKLPKSIENKHAVVNVRNEFDNFCFKWAVLSAYYPQKRNTNYLPTYQNKKALGEVNFEGLSFPTPPEQVEIFEKNNPNISIHLYILKKKNDKFGVYPYYLTPEKKDKHYHLLIVYPEEYYIDEDADDYIEKSLENSTVNFNYHYTWIKNLPKLLGRQYSKTGHKIYACDRCIHFFHEKNKLDTHEKDCRLINKCKITLPKNEAEATLSFKNVNYAEWVPITIYSDIECLLKKIEVHPESVSGKSVKIQEHQAHSIGFYVKNRFSNELNGNRSYRQEEENQETSAQWFVRSLEELCPKIQKVFSTNEAMMLTSRDKENFRRAQKCHICKKPFTKDCIKVRDHCHFTSKYRGAAHQVCNLFYKNARYIPIILHNLSNYDSHFLIKEIANDEILKGNVRIIAQNGERYISFTKYVQGMNLSFRFIDSFRFMPLSLEKLAGIAKNFEILDEEFAKDGFTDTELLKKKGVFPYEYIQSFEQLRENKLPAPSEFASTLTNSQISNDDYEHATKVWSMYNKDKTLGGYSDVYLKTDVLLLACIFENFRSTCMKYYKLDSAHFLTTPLLTWNAMLKHTEVELELLQDIDMLMFIERGIRGGVSQCSNRYSKANNIYMGKENYNPNEDDKYIIFLDINNLYGWAMTQPLPYKNFEWVRNPEEIDLDDYPDEFNLEECPDESSFGLILEVDLECPNNERYHDDHKDLPFCPEHGSAPGSTQKRLMTQLTDKNRYVIHYRALKQAIKNGMILKKIHRALKFEQKAWLKKYVDYNTDMRKAATTEFDILFFKLMINAVYEKTMENKRNHEEIKMGNEWDGRYGVGAMLSNAAFKRCTIFFDKLVAVHMRKLDIYMDKPIYVGLSVLDLSKIKLYDFHYEFMKKNLKDQAKLLYTDTDSLLYEVKNVNIYDVKRKNPKEFDTSNYSIDNEFGSVPGNKKVLGIMKDECGGKIITEFIGIRSKLYNIQVQGVKPIMKAKGIKSCLLKSCFVSEEVRKSVIVPEDFKKCLIDKTIKNVVQCNIRSRDHIVKTEKVNKIALDPADEKRYLIPGRTDTLPWGHYKAIDKEKFNELDEEDLDLLGTIVNIDNDSLLPTLFEKEVVGETFEIQPHHPAELIHQCHTQPRHLKRNLNLLEASTAKKFKDGSNKTQ